MNIQNIDKFLFHYLNQVVTHPFLDKVMPVITDLHKEPKFLMFALPALLILWLWVDRLRALKTILVLVLAIGVSDNINSKGLKPLFDRPRPNLVEPNAILRTHQHAGTSFPSTHAANVATGAMILSGVYLAWAPLYFLILFLIMWSRVYVGVHYPFDVMGGAFVGWVIGFIFYKMFRVLLNTKPIVHRIKENRAIRVKSNKKRNVN